MQILMVDENLIKKIKESFEKSKKGVKLISPNGNEIFEIKKYKDKSRELKKVRCVNDGLIFDSVEEASEYYDCSPKGIYQAIRLGCRCKGNNFEYYKRG